MKFKDYLQNLLVRESLDETKDIFPSFVDVTLSLNPDSEFLVESELHDDVNTRALTRAWSMVRDEMRTWLSKNDLLEGRHDVDEDHDSITFKTKLTGAETINVRLEGTEIVTRIKTGTVVDRARIHGVEIVDGIVKTVMVDLMSAKNALIGIAQDQIKKRGETT